MTFTAGTGNNAKYTPEVQKANFKAWLANTDYLKDHRGQYFDRYAANLPFESHIDVHVGQKFNFMIGNHAHSVELVLDIINFANLLSPNWGRSYGQGINSYYNPINYSKGALQFLHDANYQMYEYADYYSRWKMQLGLRYSF